MESVKSSTIERVLAAAALAAGGLGVFLVGRFNPSTSNFFPVCPLHAVTGFSCSGCGVTRGFHSLLHGDIFTALQFNLFIPFYFFGLLYIFASLFLLVVRGNGLSFKIFTPTVLYLFVSASVLFTVLRNLPFYPFTLFSH